MPTAVTDFTSNKNDQIKHAAEVIGRSERRRVVFEAVYHGKKKVKTVTEIAGTTGLSEKQVLEAGKVLAKNGIIGQTKIAGKTAYEKYDAFSAHKVRILSYAGNPAKLAKLPTKTNPRGGVVVERVRVEVPVKMADVRHLTVDDIASLKKVQRVKPNEVVFSRMPEKDFKDGFKKIVGVNGRFQDWGGEKNDLWTTQFKVKSTRLRTAVAFKGPGQRGVLTPAKMGKNGDQIQRLFSSDAQVFLLQYWAQVDESVAVAMNAHAYARSIQHGGETVYYGIIDGTDSARLIKAYSDEFPKEKQK